jgi:hypothetical protein
MSARTVNIPEEELAALDAIAERESRPMDDLIREAVSQYLATRERTRPAGIGVINEEAPNWPRSIGMIREDDGSLRSDNVDEWLKEHWRPE